MSAITLKSELKPSVTHFKELKVENDVCEYEPLETDRRPTVCRLLGQQTRAGGRSGTHHQSMNTISGYSYLRSKSCKLLSCMSFSRVTIRPSDFNRNRSASLQSLKSDTTYFFCDWMPVLFGVDEETIPEPEEEEMYGEDFFLEAEDEEEGHREAPIAEAEEIGPKKPRFGRRARPKPNLKRKDGEPFECTCDIDLTFDRHYVPHFGGGVKDEGTDWRIPHFKSYWEDYKDALAADKSLLKLVDHKAQEEAEEETKKVIYERPKPKLIGPKKEARRHILDTLRPLTCRELRRYRMPYSEAVILELEEDGFVESANFLRNLLIVEYQLDQDREKCPTIRESKTKVNNLAKLLTAVERRGRKQEFNSQSVILLKMGKYFCEAESTWWWLAERLFERAVEVASKYVMDGGKAEAIARYIYGTFLLDYAGKVHAAQEHLTKARELSLGRDWNAGPILNKVQEPIYKECCNHLCRALIETGKKLRREGKPEEALQYIHHSYKLCEESNTSRKDIELETLFELGMTYQDAGDLEWAKAAFKKYVAKAKIEDYHRSVCDGHLELAICYRLEGEINPCHYHLKMYLEHATAHNDENLKAFGNRYIGEFLLNHGHSKSAVSYFEKAFESFLQQHERTGEKQYAELLPEELTLQQDVELARVLTGLAKGEILTKPICRLILRARDVRNQTDTLKLLKWKNSQEICFDMEEDVSKKPAHLLELESHSSGSDRNVSVSEESSAIEEDFDMDEEIEAEH